MSEAANQEPELEQMGSVVIDFIMSNELAKADVTLDQVVWRNDAAIELGKLFLEIAMQGAKHG